MWGLVLAGGGAKGSYHMGVWQALRELNIKIGAVAGASIGAIIGAMVVQGDFHSSMELWKKIRLDDIVKIPSYIDTKNIFAMGNIKYLLGEMKQSNGLDTAPLEELLREVIDEDKIRRSPIDFAVTAFSMNRKSEVRFFKDNMPKGKMIDLIIASACLPIFRPKNFKDDVLIDCGFLNNMPTNVLVEKGYRDIIQVDIKGIGGVKPVDTSNINVITVRPKQNNVGTLEFDPEQAAGNIEAGYYDCFKVFGKYVGNHYYIPTENYYRARRRFSEDMIDHIEKIAKIYKIDNMREITVENLIDEILKKYNETNSSNENLIEKILSELIMSFKSFKGLINYLKEHREKECL